MLLYGTISPIWHLFITCFLSGHYLAIPLGILAYELNPVTTYLICLGANILYSIVVIYLIHLLKKGTKSYLNTNENIEKKGRISMIVKSILAWLKRKEDISITICLSIIAVTTIIGMTSGIALAEAYSISYKKYFWLILAGLIMGCLWVTIATLESVNML